MLHMTPSTHHSKIDFESILNIADNLAMSIDFDKIVAHAEYDVDSIVKTHNLSYFICVCRSIVLHCDDLNFIDELYDFDFDEINLSTLICCFDEYDVDFDDLNVLTKLSELTHLPLYDLRVLSNFFECKRR
jgi:hypothetical protein